MLFEGNEREELEEKMRRQNRLPPIQRLDAGEGARAIED